MCRSLFKLTGIYKNPGRPYAFWWLKVHSPAHKKGNRRFCKSFRQGAWLHPALHPCVDASSMVVELKLKYRAAVLLHWASLGLLPLSPLCMAWFCTYPYALRYLGDD